MNTLFRIVDVDDETGGALYEMDDCVLDDVVEGLKYNNAYLPPIDHVVFNTKTEDWVTDPGKDGDKPVKAKFPLENPVLATIVYFADGTKVTVKNCAKDKITLVDEVVKLPDGTETTVRTASHESKEAGLQAALVKRLYCWYDENGNVNGGSYSKFLHEVISGARCQDVEEAKAAVQKRISRERRAEANKHLEELESKPKKEKKRSAFQSTTDKLAEVTQNLAKLTAELANIKKGQDEN